MKRWKLTRALSALLAMTLLLAAAPQLTLTAHAASGACGEHLTWSFDEASGTLTISGFGEMASRELPPWFDYRESITEVRLPDGLTTIAESAFDGCRCLASITIPDGVTSIGRGAFAGCKDLASITIPDSVTAIDEYAFYSCNGLTSVTIPESVISLGDCVFEECHFLETVKLPRHVTSFGIRTFYYCTKLKSVTVPEGVEHIGLYCFSNCVNLESISLPDSVKDIGEHAFDGCTMLSGITVPANVESVGNYAFENCASLTEMILPASVRQVGYRAFAGCDKLSRITILNQNCEFFDAWYSTGIPAETVVCADSGSTAEAYAKKYGYPFEANGLAHWFADVDSNAYYADAVIWAVEKGITNGTGNSLFSPENTCTRAQVVTFLWRAAGRPEPRSNTNPFADVAEGQYYYKAVLWAVEQGITTGTSAGRFSPDSGCTRGQVVTFLWRAAGKPAPESTTHPFTDVRVGEYYEKPVIWAVESGITTGTAADRFSPAATCKRAQIATFLYRTSVEPVEPVPGAGDLIGVSFPDADVLHWSKDGNYLKEELKAAGYKVDLRFAAGDPAVQASQIGEMVENGAKLIIVAAIDGAALDAVLDRAKKAGCAVVSYGDSPIVSDAISYYIVFDRFSIGAAQGKFIVDQLGLDNAGDRVCNLELVGGTPDDGDAYIFYDGAMSFLEPYIDAGTLNVVSGRVEFEDVVTEDWSSEMVQANFENLLSACYSDQRLDAVWCANDALAQGVAAALENVYRNDGYPILTGQGCNVVSVRNMLNGKQAMSVFRDTRILSARTAAIADDILQGIEAPTSGSFTTADGAHMYPAFYCDPGVCTKDNIQEILIDYGYFTWEELGVEPEN